MKATNHHTHQQEPNFLDKYDAWIIKWSKCDESFTVMNFDYTELRGVITYTHSHFIWVTHFCVDKNPGEMEMSCPLLKLLSLAPSCRSLLPNSAQYDRRVNTDAEQQTKGDRFISGDSPACCRNQTNSTCNYLAEINWQREERRENISCFDHGYVFDPDSVFDKNAIFGSRCFWWNLPTLMC